MLVRNPNDIRLGMIGMVDANGHPYSWSAIINGGFDAQAMSQCDYPVIGQYLGAAKPGQLGIPGAKVTHIWCDNPDDAKHVAKASLIPNIVSKPQDVIGKVDAVFIPTDRGNEHLDRAQIFIDAGIPVFIDKPLTDRADHLKQFVAWQLAGKPILSSSSMRYCAEYLEATKNIQSIGALRMITCTTPKSWERYGIHALEGAYLLARPGGWKSVTNTGSEKSNIVHVHHEDGIELVLAAIYDMTGCFGCLNIYGTQGMITTRSADTLVAFKAQLVEFITYLRTGVASYPFSQTVELMKIVIAGIQSREQDGKRIFLSDILV